MNFYDLDPARQQSSLALADACYLRQDVARYHPFLRRLYREANRPGACADRGRLRFLACDSKRRPSRPSAAVRSAATEPGRSALPGRLRYRGAPAVEIARLAARRAQLSSRPQPGGPAAGVSRQSAAAAGRSNGCRFTTMRPPVPTGEPTPVMFTLRDLHGPVREMAQLAIRPKNPLRLRPLMNGPTAACR